VVTMTPSAVSRGQTLWTAVCRAAMSSVGGCDCRWWVAGPTLPTHEGSPVSGGWVVPSCLACSLGRPPSHAGQCYVCEP
jgi:hypothetical protein